MKYKLYRTGERFNGMWGVTKVGGEWISTVERPWIPDPNGKPGGLKFHSCIPAGFYAMEEHIDVDSGERTWALVGEHVAHYPTNGIPRDLCLFDVANFPSQVEGCVGVGLTAGDINGEYGVQSSGSAMSYLRGAIDINQTNYLTIIDPA